MYLLLEKGAREVETIAGFLCMAVGEAVWFAAKTILQSPVKGGCSSRTFFTFVTWASLTKSLFGTQDNSRSIKTPVLGRQCFYEKFWIFGAS